jgi:hypothetical protein
MFLIIFGSLMAVCVLMFMNDMIVRSLALSFSLASLIVIAVQPQVCHKSIVDYDQSHFECQQTKIFNFKLFFFTLVANKDSLWYCEKFL